MNRESRSWNYNDGEENHVNEKKEKPFGKGRTKGIIKPKKFYHEREYKILTSSFL